MKKSNQLMRICVAAAVAGWSAGAQPAGFALIEQNASGLGNAYSGQAAAAENASTIYYNPSGMTNLPGTQISGVLSAIRPSAKFSDSGASLSPIPGLIPLGGNGGDAGGWNYLPTGYLSWQINPQIWAGLGLSSPFGLKTQYDAAWIGRFQSQLAQLTTYDINPSVAWKINDTFSVGAGVSYQHTRLQLNRSQIVPVPVLPGVVEVPSSFDLSDNAWGWNLGATFKPGPDTRIGLSYRSSVSYNLNGPVQVVGAFSTTGTTSLRMPDTTSLGLSQKLTDQWQLLADVTYTRWSSVQTIGSTLANSVPVLPINARFSDTWRVGVGANYQWTQNFMLKLGVAYDKSPVSDQFRTTILPDNDRTWLAIGGKWQLSKQAAFDFGYAHLFVKSGPINQALGVGTLPFQGAVVGNYQDSVDILSVQYTYAF